MTEKTSEYSLDQIRREITSSRTLFISEKRDFKCLRSGRLIVAKGTDQSKELTIDRERIVIGRSSGCHFVLSDTSVSSLHAEIVADPDGYLLRDLGSTNGIFMLGHKIKEVLLRPGSEFQIGNNLMRFEPLDALVKIPLSAREYFGGALGRSTKMREVFALLEKSSTSELSILLRGETGTGKELLASAIHNYSMRKNRSFQVLDCGAVPVNLIEDVLFGHERGAFTGAEQMRKGLFEEAKGGTLFIDEVGDLRLGLQPKLLRVLERREIQRLGGVEQIPVDVRIVAATHRDLWGMVDEELFRQDLLYRLSVVEVVIPPLRERTDDIPLLVENFLKIGNLSREKMGLGPVEFDEDAIMFLQAHPWPGNVRELRNVIDRSVMMTEKDLVGRQDLLVDIYGGGLNPTLSVDCSAPFKDAKSRLLEQFERQYLIQLMEKEGGNLSAASRRAGLARQYLRNLCRRYSIPCGSTSKS